MSHERLKSKRLQSIVAVAVAVACLCVWTGCGSKSGSGDDRASTNGSNPGDDEKPDYTRCLQSFDYITSQCGALFYNEAGDPMTQNDLLQACGQPNVECAMTCYEADSDCSAIKTCLLDTCRLV